MTDHIRIISLGEIVTPNVMKTIQALKVLITQQKNSADPKQVEQAIAQVVKQHEALIEQFKLGKVDEAKFTKQMIAALENATDSKISIAEFDRAWNAMNPDFKQFAALLQQAIDYNNQPGHKIIFVSFTNPKDIRHLVQEFESHQQSYKIVDNQLVEIAGIPLHTSYAKQQTKAQLIENLLKSLHTSPLAASMSKALNTSQPKLDIKYIRGVNQIEYPSLKAVLEKTNQEVQDKTEAFFVDTILWKKWEQPSLSEVLRDEKLVSMPLPVSKL